MDCKRSRLLQIIDKPCMWRVRQDKRTGNHLVDVQEPLDIRRSAIFVRVAASYQERVKTSRTEKKTAVFKSFECFFF